jgi:aspartyl/asparaginyl-tRNA synthetase
LFKYFSETYPNETLHWSGYSIDGWKYLRKTILELSDKYNVKLNEKGIEYFTRWDNSTKTFIEDYSEESRKLYDQSKEEIKKYNNDYDF